MANGGAVPAGGKVATPVYCRRCGYNLFGLPVDGACPECGLPTWETILHTVDPAASGLPTLRDPRIVGDALVWLIGCFAAASALLGLRPLALWVDAMDPTGVRDVTRWAPVEIWFAAAAIALASLWGVRRLMPAGGSEDSATRGDLRLLAGGTLAWAVLVAAATLLAIGGSGPTAIGAIRLGVAGAAVVALLGLRGVLRTIGLRSREYRTARGGRQGIRAMIAAIAGVALGQLLQLPAAAGHVGALATIGVVTSTIGMLMVVIGLLYLVVNAWWIRRSLRCPPPRLDQVIGEP